MKYLAAVLIVLTFLAAHGEQDCSVEKVILDKCLESLPTDNLCEVCLNDSIPDLPGANCTVLTWGVCNDIQQCGCEDCTDESIDFASCAIDLKHDTSCDLRCGQSNQRPSDEGTSDATPLKAEMAILMSGLFIGLMTLV